VNLAIFNIVIEYAWNTSINLNVVVWTERISSSIGAENDIRSAGYNGEPFFLTKWNLPNVCDVLYIRLLKVIIQV